MKLVLTLYWAGAYTAGIVCLSALAFRWLHRREESTIRLLAFLASMGLSMSALALREATVAQGSLAGLLGAIALAGGGLSTAAFPRYAASISGDARLKARAAACAVAGLGLAALDALAAILPERRLALAAGLLTFVSLAASVILSLSWMRAAKLAGGADAGRPGNKAGMFLFLAIAGLVVFLDFLGGWSLILPAPAPRLLLFPACYGLLSAWLLKAHLATWLPRGAPMQACGPPDAGAPQRAVSQSRRALISGREAEVAALLAKGRTYREMAEELCISLATIKSHLTHLYDKTGTRNKVELLNFLREREDPA
jgi:DNA-binding CsgD family transcriptional regulator